ncbi:MAG TPA: hypothetical protein VLF18_00735 [Tahibacter sp.]|uniref:hypothetical protein n=1 Tax=Tahibacter sp. TaxID=2056211 RepID=UPI002CDDBD43|nr:hypothetical protein [Tahibacter sp.]HSX58699.1 hypothetical protein [Tahibacter sp.]
MFRIKQGLLLATALLAGQAHAVVLGVRDQGQALIFPYYNVQAGNTTLLQLANNSDHGKVVQLRVAEGQIGETALVFNLYLAGRDSWSGAIAADTPDGGAVLLSDDASCVIPALTTAVPNQPGRRLQELRIDDKPDADPAREREGWVEAIEIAAIAPDTMTDRHVGNVAAVPRYCAGLAAAWTAPGGYWANQPLRDLVNPRGGISGYAAVINVAAGTFFGAAAVPLDEFRIDPADSPRGTTASVVRHFVPSARQLLTLADTVSDPDERSVVARVVADNRSFELSYPLERAVDAVSAVLTASEIAADFDTRRDIGATSSFVQVFPTKRFYTNPALLPPGTTTPLPPFRAMYNAQAPFSVIEREWLLITDREGGIVADSGGVQFGGCEASVRHPATALAVTMPGGNPPDALLGTRFHGPMSQVCGGGNGEPLYMAGQVTLKLGRPTFGNGPIALRPSREGLRLAGLPVIALRLVNYVNASAQQGVLANYSAVATPSASVQCVDGTGEACVP